MHGKSAVCARRSARGIPLCLSPGTHGGLVWERYVAQQGEWVEAPSIDNDGNKYSVTMESFRFDLLRR